MVMKKYPVTDEQRHCWQKMLAANFKRDAERKRLREGKPDIEANPN